MCRFVASQRLVTVVRSFRAAARASFQSADFPALARELTKGQVANVIIWQSNGVWLCGCVDKL